MTFLFRHFVVFHVAVLAIYTSWAFAGTRVAWLPPIFWLTLGVIEAVVLLPACQEGESIESARDRVLRSLVVDPLFAIGVLLTLFLAFQGFNGPREMVYLADQEIWRAAPPPLPGFPSGFATREAVQLLAWFPPAVMAALAIRHAMDAAGRRLLLHILVWNAAALALSGCIQYALGLKAIYGLVPIEVQYFSSFGYPNHAGAFFTFMLVVAGGVWLHERERVESGADRLLIAVALIYGGAVLCLSRTSILMGTAVLLLGTAFSLVRVWPTFSLGQRVNVSLVTGLSSVGALFSFFVDYPGNPIRRELGSLTLVSLFRQVCDRAFEMLAPMAIAIWRDNPWYGVGGWGFRHFVSVYLTPEQYKKLFIGAANVHNDTINFLAEHGIVGTLLLVLVGLVLLIPLLERAAVSRFSPKLLRWFMLVAVGLVMCHSLIDLPFRCPAVIQVVLLTLAAVGCLCRDAGRETQ